MNANQFDNSENPEEAQEPIEKMAKMSSRKAKTKEGFFMSGSLYQSKTTNIVKHLAEDTQTKGMFRLNEWLQRIEYTRSPHWDKNIKEGKAIDDNDPLYIKAWLADKYYYEPSVSLIQESLFLVASRQRIHPVKEYLESLKWDGVSRLDSWLAEACNVENNSYNSQVGRKMICAMLKRVYEPGCQFDNLIVLEGKEGIYKTTMLRILGGQWYAPFSIKAESKDAVDVMQGKWLLEMEELATLRGSEIEYVDAFLSRNVDRVRLSYRRNAQDFPRQCILVGTMNPIGDNQYLKKQSENRRFWPIECHGTIKINWIKENRDQLFAEGMRLYKKEQLFLDNEEAIKISLNKLEERKSYDVWIDIINDWLMGKNVASLEEILTKCLGITKEKISHSNIIRVGICMRQLHWLPKQLGRKKKKYYVRPDADINDINDGIERIDWGEEEEK